MNGLIDRWVVSHLVFWAAFVGWLTWFFAGVFTFPMALAVIGYGSIAWEVVEFKREQILGYRPENMYNRLVVDPLTNTAGGLSGWFIVGVIW